MPHADLELRAQARVGTVLRGKYRLERVLGAGGMGAVYLGVHRNGHRVAVKVLHAEAGADPDVWARFLREGYVANSIGHPGAVRVLDDDVADDGAAFLVMELLEGETLHVRAKRSGGRLPPREVLALGRELCDVLAAAHAKGVVHRDIKPENLFLTTARALKVLDFGIARGGAGGAPLTSRRAATDALLLEGATRAGAALGTPAFMPPEQALGNSRDVDARSDLWAAGATLFTLLSGKLVHEAPFQQELLVRAATCPARSLADAAPDTPVPIVAVVDRALRFSRDERWPSARAMAEAIDEAYLAVFGEPVAQTAIGPVLTTPPSPRSRAEQGPRTPVVADTILAGGAGGTTKEALSTSVDSFPGTMPDTLAPFSPQAGATRGGADATGPSSRTSAPTLVAGGGEPAPQPPVSEPVPSRSAARTSTRVPSASPPPQPSERGGKILAVGLMLAVAAALVIAHARRSDGDAPSEDAAGQAPCFHDADCRTAGLVCGPGGRCVPGHSGCSSSRACVQSNGGKAAICRADGACVPLESAECKVLAEPGDIGNDATVWVGAMFPLTGHDAQSYGEDSVRMVDLARRDFAEVAGGLAPATPGGPKRPIAVVACDDAVSPARAAAHLVDEVGVPAILGFARSQEVTDLAASVFTPKGVLALASNTASMLRAIPHPPGQPRLVWRTTTSADMTVPADAAILAGVLEPALRATPGLLAPGEPIRVALLRIGNTSGLSHADLYASLLRFNGKTVAENGQSFRQVVVADAGEDQRAAALSRAAGEVVAFRPHVVIQAAGQAGVLPEVERAWPATERFRPRYLLAGEGTDPVILGFVQQHLEAASRMLNVDTSANTPAVAKLVLRRNEVFPDRRTAGEITGAPYDAFYTFAYAAAALGGERITGLALARAIPRLLPPGEPVDVGPGGIYQALSLLGAGKNIDLTGSITSLDFDLETGDATADFAVSCVAPAADGGPPKVVESGLVYRARTRKLEGALRCP